MTEIALRDTRIGDGYLTAWAHSAREAAGIAVSLARTPFVPASLRNADRDVTVGNITAAILTGIELGLTPMAALRSIDIIQGTPTLRAIALRGLVLAAGHDIVVAESTATRAIVRGRRRGSDEWQSSTWTTDRARTAGLLGRDQWKAQPTSMLIARATAECARLIAADVLLAMPYISEELDDGDNTSPAQPPPPAAPRATAQRRTQRKPTPPPAPIPAAQPAEDEPPFDDGDQADPDQAAAPAPEPPHAPPPATPSPEPAQPDDETNLASREQLNAMHAAFRHLGITDRTERLTITRHVIGRQIASAKDLWRAEAGAVLDELAERRRRLDTADEDAALEAAYEADQTGSDDEPGTDD